MHILDGWYSIHNKLTAIPTRGVSHSGLAIYVKKYLKAKEEF
jgi:hypothetical protein